FYPRRGFGQISEAYGEAAVAAGAELRLGARVTRLAPRQGAPGWVVGTEGANGEASLEADYLWSTIPITTLARAMPDTPPPVLAAADQIRYRAMLLVYLVLDVERFTEYDAHYFPDPKITITRLSEPKNYSVATEPRGRTILCAELPCDADDTTWRLDDAALGRLVADDLARAGIPLARPPVGVAVRRLRQAYPIYLNGYEQPLGVLDDWSLRLTRVLSYGRQGLFAHDNTHHALFMAYAAAECLGATGFDEQRWASYREVFKTHVVED
ncbi:MAG TPA: hypothetical protein VLD58_05485, partial [Gemmatimonadales bacterium]|nr:hypothetical protein [Gemmatimonadales bacterium]